MSEPNPLWSRPLPLLDREVDGGGRLNALLTRLSPERLGRLASELGEAAYQRGMWLEEGGTRRRLPFALRPRLLDLRCRGYVHHVTWQLRLALRRLSQVLRDDPLARRIVPLGEGERGWLERYRRPAGGGPGGERIFCRLDALGRLDGPGRLSTLRFVEPNVVGVGGLRYIAEAESLLIDKVIPAISGFDPELAFDRNSDPRRLLLEELYDHARERGVRGPPFIAFVDDCSLYRYGGEFGQIVPWFQRQGADAIYVDVRALSVGRDGRVVADGRAVDVVYRYLELRDLAQLESRGEDLSGIRAAFASGIVVPTAGGDLEHKSTFDLLTDPHFRHHFTEEMGEVIDAHVLWTRLLAERRTPGPDGQLVDLVPWVERHRERLVLKPNRESGGEGVILGEGVSEAAWHDALSKAVAEAGSYVVQERTPPDRELLPAVLPDGTVTVEPWYVAAGFYPGRSGLAILGRMAKGQVVNVHAGGGVSPFLVEVA